jgi:tetratricopeptide (TPR) repeat protein
MDINSILQGVTGVAAAVGALLGGLAGIVSAVTNLKKERQARREQEKARLSDNALRREPRRRFYLVLLKKPLFLGGVFLLILAGNLFVWYVARPVPATNERLTMAAWDALAEGDYAEAEARARECIREFEGQALREQEALKARGDAPPPVGSVSEAQRQRIFARGPLNDVGTSYFILGQALEEMERREEAARAYKGAQQFPYARFWDPRGWFNSPADAATDRLRALGIENPRD